MRDELGTKLPLVQLLPARDAVEPISTKEGFGRVAEYAAAVALPYEMLVERAASGAHALRVSSLVPMIRSASVALHAYTLRRDHLPEWAPSFEDLLRFLLADAGIDALFCDHPDIAVGIRNSLC
jgi:glycerophosphoryl diester phosphodiesterase